MPKPRKPKPIYIHQIADPEFLLATLRQMERDRDRINSAIRAVAEQLARLAMKAKGNDERRP